MFRGRKTYKVNKWCVSSSDGFAEDREEVDIDFPSDASLDADVVSSEVAHPHRPSRSTAGWHMPVLDIDVPHHYEPSTTPGHGHLYIDVPVEWPEYAVILRALGDAGILEPGYVGASLDRRATFVRLPWIKKGARRGQAPASA